MDKQNIISILNKIVTSKGPRNMFYQNYNGEFKLTLDKIIPEIYLSINTPQRSIWHIYPVFDHILEAIKGINTLSCTLSKKEQKMLSFIMLFHDLGKPKCRQEKTKNGKIYDTFYFHNVESEKIARRTLPSLNFEKDLNLMCKLILDHDFFISLSENFYKESQIYLDNKNFPTTNINGSSYIIGTQNNKKNPKIDNKTYNLVLNNTSIPTNKALFDIFSNNFDKGNVAIKNFTNSINKKIEELNSFGDGKHLFYLLCLIGTADNLSQNISLSYKTLDIVKLALCYLNLLSQ